MLMRIPDEWRNSDISEYVRIVHQGGERERDGANHPKRPMRQLMPFT